MIPLKVKPLSKPVPPSVGNNKLAHNPFRSDHPELFKSTQPPSESSRNAEKIQPVSHPQYQSVITPEIRANFCKMNSILGVLPCEVEALQVVIPSSSKKCLAVDLDETLIHTLVPSFDYPGHGIHLPKKAAAATISTEEWKVPVVVRPFAKEFLAALSQVYQIVVPFFVVAIFYATML